MTILSFQEWSKSARNSPFVIVGAGAVGIAMAVWLSRAGQRVTLLEGGPFTPPVNFQQFNKGESKGKPHRGIREGRMKAYGGGTRLWGGQLAAFDSGDFQRRGQDGALLWPISFETYEEWLDRALDLLAISAADRDADGVWQTATGHSAQFGKRFHASLCLWLKQPDFTTMFARELRHSPLIEIVTDAKLSDLKFSAEGSVERATVTASDGTAHHVHPKVLVLANGTFEIAASLLRAQRDDPLCPLRRNAHVGRWYIDHLHGFIAEIEGHDPALLAQLFDTIYHNGRKFTVKLRRLPEFRSPTEPNIAVTISPGLSAGQALREARDLFGRVFSGQASPLRAVSHGVRALLIAAPAALRYLSKHRAKGHYGGLVNVGLEVEQLPTPESRLFLSDAAGPAHGAVGVQWQLDGAELAAMRAIAEQFAEAMAETGIGTVRCDPRLMTDDPAVFDQFHDASHQMGGARMALSPDLGVVDADCKVFGTSNLFVAGAATFPAGSFANPTLTAIALGLRLANHLIEHNVRANASLMPRLVFGTARLTGGVSLRSSRKLLHAALDAGVRTIDCAPPYGIGSAEDVVGAVLRERPDATAIKVIAKVGIARPRHPRLMALLRAAKRLVSPTPPHNFDAWQPSTRQPDAGRGNFSAEAMAASLAVTAAKVGHFDTLLLHECGSDEFTPAVADAISRLAAPFTAQVGYGWGAQFDAAQDARFPPGYVCECAIPAAVLDGSVPPPTGRQFIFHSLAATSEYLCRSNPGYAESMARAQKLLTGVDAATARIAVAFALAASRAPEAKLVFASSDPIRLERLLGAFHLIDTQALIEPIAGMFAAAD